MTVARLLPTDRFCLRRCSRKKLDPCRLIAHHFQLDQIIDVYDTFSRVAETKTLKVIIEAYKA